MFRVACYLFSIIRFRRAYVKSPAQKNGFQTRGLVVICKDCLYGANGEAHSVLVLDLVDKPLNLLLGNHFLLPESSQNIWSKSK